MVSTSCPVCLGNSSEVLWGLQAVPGDSVPCLRARVVDQLSQVNRARVRAPAVSPRSSRLLGPLPKAPRCQPDVPGDTGPALRARGVDQLSRYSRQATPGVSHSGPMARGVNKLSRGSRALVLAPAVTVRSPGRLGPVPVSHQVNQMSQATPAWLRGPAGPTSCPGKLALVSEGPWG